MHFKDALNALGPIGRSRNLERHEIAPRNLWGRHSRASIGLASENRNHQLVEFVAALLRVHDRTLRRQELTILVTRVGTYRQSAPRYASRRR